MGDIKVFQIKVSLTDSSPLIWRRILIESDTLLPDLHHILQTVMGWEDCHLHQFIDKKERYGGGDEEFLTELDLIDYSQTRIGSLLKKEKYKVVYQYDFGDNWDHELLLEKISEKEEGQKYPHCLEGEMAGPVEDSGGVWGYMDLLDALKDSEHQYHAEAVEGLGEDYDPARFDKEAINAELERQF